MSPRRSSRPASSPCAVCTAVGEKRLELDLYMGDPARWPAAVWGVFDAPSGPDVPPVMREWGALQVGQQWLIEHGFGDLNKARVREHYERHVSLVPTTPDQLVAAGVLASGGKMVDIPSKSDPLAFLRYYTKGLEVGQKGLSLLLKHIEQIERDPNAEIPLPLIKLMVDVGAKLAVSQAQIRAREKSQPTDDDDDDAFRGGADGPPGPRFDHNRIRTVGGVTGPIHDEGPKDRAAYNERAAQEGLDRL